MTTLQKNSNYIYPTSTIRLAIHTHLHPLTLTPPNQPANPTTLKILKQQQQQLEQAGKKERKV